MAQIIRSCVQLRKLVLPPGSQRGGNWALLPAPPGCHIIPRMDTMASRVKTPTAAWALLGLMAAQALGYLASLLDSDSA